MSKNITLMKCATVDKDGQGCFKLVRKRFSFYIWKVPL